MSKTRTFFSPTIFQSPWNFQWETLLQCRMKWPKKENESCPLQFREWAQDNPVGCGRMNFKSLIGTYCSCVPKNCFLHPPSSECLAVIVQALPKYFSTCCDDTTMFWGRYKQCPFVSRQFHSHMCRLWEAHSIASSLFGKIRKVSGQLSY